jgi:RNA polymerase sigma factor (sigma-70 family)
MSVAETPLERQLRIHRGGLLRFLISLAGPTLLRLESAEDLLQGVCYEALRSADRYEDRGDDEALPWLHLLCRRHIKARREYWFALKRNSAKVLRLTWSGEGTGLGIDPVDTATGPSSFAFRREQLETIIRSLALLLPRDRQLVRWASEDLELDEQARRLELSRGALERARQRALERLRKTLSVVRLRPPGS